MNRAVLSVVLCLVAALPAFAQNTSPVAQPESPAVVLPQNPALWLNAPPVSLESLKGKGVVLYCYEEGCPRCRERWPEVLAAAKKFEGQPVVFIAVNSGNPTKSVASYLRSAGINWPTIADQDRTLEKALGITEVSLQNIWQTVAITPDGKLRQMGGNVEGAAQAAAAGASWKVDPKGVPADLKAAWLAVELGNYTQAAPAIRKSLASAKSDVKTAAEGLEAAVKKELDVLVSQAEQANTQGDKWAAYKLYQQVGAEFKGFASADEAAKLGQALATDPAVATQQKAFAALESARKTGSKGTDAAIRRAKGMLERLVKDMPDTEAATQASELLAKLPQ